MRRFCRGSLLIVHVGSPKRRLKNVTADNDHSLDKLAARVCYHYCQAQVLELTKYTIFVLNSQMGIFVIIKLIVKDSCTLIAILTNSLLIYLALTKSPPKMGNYKYLLCYFSVLSITYVTLDFLAAPVKIKIKKKTIN